MQEQTSLLKENAKIKVSSTLNRDTKQFGKQHLTDGNHETCWNSDQGLPQFIQIDWQMEVLPQLIQVEFQGGFAGKVCKCQYNDTNDEEWKLLMEFYPNDSSLLQSFNIPPMEQRWIKKCRILIEEATDFYGRITIYKLDLLGMKKNLCPF